MDRLPKRAHSTVVRTNSIRLLAGNDNPGISDIPIITTPHFDLFPQYEVEEHEQAIDVSKSVDEQTVKKQSPQVEKDDSFFLPFYDVEFKQK